MNYFLILLICVVVTTPTVIVSQSAEWMWNFQYENGFIDYMDNPYAYQFNLYPDPGPRQLHSTVIDKNGTLYLFGGISTFLYFLFSLPFSLNLNSKNF